MTRYPTERRGSPAHAVGKLPWDDRTWRSMAGEASPTLSPEWAAAWFSAFGMRYVPNAPLLRRAGDDPLLPLVRHRRHPWRLELLGVRELHEPMDALGDEDAIKAELAALAARGESLDLGRVPADSVLVSAVKQAYSGRGVVLVRAAAPSPTLPIDDSWVRPADHMSNRRRADLRRARRRAEQRGEVTYEVVEGHDGGLDVRFDEFMATEAAGWKGRAGTALGCQPPMAAFYRAYAHAAARAGELRLSFLRIDGRAAAVQLAVQRAGALWLLKIGYDETFGACSPGTLLLVESLGTAAGEGARSVEFLGRAEPWTARWTTRERPTVRILAYGRRLGALPAMAEDAYRLLRNGVRNRTGAGRRQGAGVANARTSA